MLNCRINLVTILIWKKKKIEQSFGKDNMISLDFSGIGPLKNNNLNLCYKSIQQKSNC